MARTKHCPFCRGTAEPVRMPFVNDEGFGYVVQCNGCWAKTGYYDTVEEAIAAWNSRDNVPMRVDVPESCDVRISVNHPPFRCPKCGHDLLRGVDRWTS